MKKQHKSSITKNHRIKKNFFLPWCSLKRLHYKPRKLFSDFVPEIKKCIVGKSSN